MNDFEKNPELRFDYIKKLGEKRNLRTVYVIELRTSVLSSKSKSSYPNNKFTSMSKHMEEHRLFYVGKTFHSSEERFHLAKNNHMAKNGVVKKHRLIRDEYPYTESISSLSKLTNQFGYENPRGIDHNKFEHYVAWALYKCGYSTWGPKIKDLGAYKDLNWLGKEPYL
tara:strand:+ start:95 stop:598 length:504 start_codon:yes stop_codon:yes gene_type:complete